MDGRGGRPYSSATKPITGSPERPNNMSLIQTLGPHFAVALIFFGVLLFSTATAVIALLADY